MTEASKWKCMVGWPILLAGQRYPIPLPTELWDEILGNLVRWSCPECGGITLPIRSNALYKRHCCGECFYTNVFFCRHCELPHQMVIELPHQMVIGLNHGSDASFFTLQCNGQPFTRLFEGRVAVWFDETLPCYHCGLLEYAHCSSQCRGFHCMRRCYPSLA